VEHFKSPFDARDLLSERAVENRAFFEDTLERARNHRFFAHAFLSNSYEASPPGATVSFVLTSFYGIVAPFTSLLFALGGQAPNLRSRFALMDNIYEEMGCGDFDAAHPRLYLRMLSSIGVSEKTVESLSVLPSIRRINEHLREVVEHRPFAVACAVLASAEATIPPSFPVLASLARRTFRHVDMSFFDRHGVRDEGHSDDAAMLFSVSADRADFELVDQHVEKDLALRAALFDEWSAAIEEPSTGHGERHSRPPSVRPPSTRPSAPPPP
jgi:pyrroloquinoline quinone (PQQ) biosynthesis protein C